MTSSGKKVGLFFGSFNPIHQGHLIIAEYMATQTCLDEVWMVVSPHNPHKARTALANDYDRLAWVEDAIAGNPRLRACAIEFSLPQPSYTIVTLTTLREKHPDLHFHLVLGADSYSNLPSWKNGDIILRDYPILVYARPGSDTPTPPSESRVQIYADVPLLHLSASYVRQCLSVNRSVRYLVPEVIREAIQTRIPLRTES